MTKRFTGRRPPLLALGTIAAGGLVLTACGDQAEEKLFSSVDECVKWGVEQSVCQGEYQSALSQHLRDAPRFDGMAACEAEYGAGRCMTQPRTDGSGAGNFFIPFMTGYLVSSAVSNLSSSGYGTYVNSGSYRRSIPVFTNRSGMLYRSDPPQIGEAPRPRPANVNTRTVSRSGFGGLSSGRMSFGG
jgi:uncharacterized protein YgiB involved in biofilm formation